MRLKSEALPVAAFSGKKTKNIAIKMILGIKIAISAINFHQISYTVVIRWLKRKSEFEERKLKNLTGFDFIN